MSLNFYPRFDLRTTLNRKNLSIRFDDSKIDPLKQANAAAYGVKVNPIENKKKDQVPVTIFNVMKQVLKQVDHRLSKWYSLYFQTQNQGVCYGIQG